MAHQNSTSSSKSFLVTVLEQHCGVNNVPNELAKSYTDPFALIITSRLVSVAVAGLPLFLSVIHLIGGFALLLLSYVHKCVDDLTKSPGTNEAQSANTHPLKPHELETICITESVDGGAGKDLPNQARPGGMGMVPCLHDNDEVAVEAAVLEAQRGELKTSTPEPLQSLKHQQELQESALGSPSQHVYAQLYQQHILEPPVPPLPDQDESQVISSLAYSEECDIPEVAVAEINHGASTMLQEKPDSAHKHSISTGEEVLQNVGEQASTIVDEVTDTANK
jgi:hypothetical protein